MGDNPERLTSDEQAREVGLREGEALRLNGAKPENLVASRETHYEVPDRHYRGPHVPHYEAWQAGFNAGYLGKVDMPRQLY